jgi:hypothetical protein
MDCLLEVYHEEADMPRTIFFRLGNKDRVTVRELIDTLHNFLGILQDLDSAISKEKRGSMAWEVAFLQKQSPPVIGVIGTPRRPIFEDISSTVESQLLENTTSLTRTSERTEYLSDSALSRIERIAKKTKKLGSITVYIDGHDPQQESVISETTLTNVRKLTGVKYSTFGSISGNLDAITVHLSNEFRVWDVNSGKPVRCKYKPEQEDSIKSLLRASVVVSGMIHANSAGSPVFIDVEEIEAKDKERLLPTIGQMSGLVEDFTEGKPLRKYLEDLDE